MACFAKIVASLVATDGFTRPKEARECSERSVAHLGAIFGDVDASDRVRRRGRRPGLQSVSREDATCTGVKSWKGVETTSAPQALHLHEFSMTLFLQGTSGFHDLP